MDPTVYLQRLISKIERNFTEGRYYEAHQLYRTLCARLLASNDTARALQSLYDGAKKFFSYKQIMSGCDLTALLVSNLQKADSKLYDTPIYLERVCELHALMPAGGAEQVSLEDAARDWIRGPTPAPGTSTAPNSASQPAVPAAMASLFGVAQPHPPQKALVTPLEARLHQRFGFTHWAARFYILARRHLLLSGDAEAAARFLVEMQRAVGRPDERDMFLAQAVLELLALGRRLAAAHLFAHFLRVHLDLCPTPAAPAARAVSAQPRPPFASPLLDFLYLLLLAIDSRKLPAFTYLCEQYTRALQRDLSYKMYLERIAQLFFGLPASADANSPLGAFGPLLQSVLSGAPGAAGVAGAPAGGGFLQQMMQQFGADDLSSDEEPLD